MRIFTRLEHMPALLLACAHLFFRLVFQPSAWRREVAAFDRDLPPDFSLAELTSHHWRQPRLQHWLFAAYVAGPLAVACLTGVGLWLAGFESVIRAMLYSWSLSMVSALISGMVISFAFSVVAALLGGFLIGVLYPWPFWSLFAGLILLCQV